jgi:fructose-1,6-bisphosphatase I
MTDTIQAIGDCFAETASDVRDLLGKRRSYNEGENPSGDQQLEADEYADEMLAQRLLAIDDVGTYASEERQAVETDSGEYHVACDPLDGSSNLKSNNGLGTIWGIYTQPPPAPGDALIAAGYVLYGPVTTMIETRDDSVTEYLINDGDRELLKEEVTLPDDPLIYGFGGRIPDWTESFDDFVHEIEASRLKLRYSGAMVNDVNQILTYGGIFGYPMLQDKPDGKLRLQFEGHPIAAIVTAAGGASSDGEQPLLSILPDHLHDRSPLFVGNESLIDLLEESVDS